MDLFDLVDEFVAAINPPPPADDWPAVHPLDDAGTMPDDELQARFLGQERAGVPSWSRSAGTVRVALDRLLASASGDRREHLARVERESYQAARIRKLARVAVENSELPE